LTTEQSVFYVMRSGRHKTVLPSFGFQQPAIRFRLGIALDKADRIRRFL